MNLQEQLKKITTFIFDVDGVLTDGTILVLEDGLQARRMNVKDGYALQLAIKKGYKILILSGAAVSPVVDRLNKLGINEVHMGVKDKKDYIEKYKISNALDTEEILFMGDDLPDLGAMSVVGISACPADAAGEIREIVQYISPHNGGWGCVRDVIEKVMREHQQWGPEDQIVSQ